MSDKVEETQTITDCQAVVIGHLLAGETQREAARLAGVNEETVSRWRRGNADFVAEINRRRSDLWKATGERILNLRVSSIVALEALLHDDDSRVRFQAAQLVLGLDLKGPVGPTSREDVEAAWRRAKRAKVGQEQFLDECAAAGI